MREGMQVLQNAETIDRFVDRGILPLEVFHSKHQNSPAGHKAEFLRGNFAGWRSTTPTLYSDCSEDLVQRVRANCYLALPRGVMGIGCTQLSIHGVLD
jgi:hypothetical protein